MAQDRSVGSYDGPLLRFKKLPEPIVLIGAAKAGLLIYPLVHP